MEPNHQFLDLEADYAEQRANHENGSVYSLCVTHSAERISHDILKAKGTTVIMQPLISLSDEIDYSSAPRTIIHYYCCFTKVLQFSYSK